MDAPARLSPKTSVHWAAIFILVALAAYLLPGARAVLIYDRSAILGGELWRLVTGHWVHFSARHLLYDAAVLGIAGWIIHFRGYRHFAVLCLLSALSISTAMLVLLPDLAFYGGLSGIAMASTVYLALHALREDAPWRGVGLLLFLLCAGKLVLDAFSGNFVPGVFDNDSVKSVPLSHVVGAACGALGYLWSTYPFPGKGDRRRKPGAAVATGSEIAPRR